MSAYLENHDDPKHVEAGKLLSKRLHEAREKKGQVICPICRHIFDATHLIKCPGCRALIDKTFVELYSGKVLKKSASHEMGASSRKVFRKEKKGKTSRKRSKKRVLYPQKALENVQLELDFSPQG